MPKAGVGHIIFFTPKAGVGHIAFRRDVTSVRAYVRISCS